MSTNLMESPLFRAAISGNIKVISRNIKDRSSDDVRRICTPNSNTILHLASRSGQLKAVQKILSEHPSLLNEVNSNGDTALHLAAKGGFIDVVRVIITCAKTLDVVNQDVESRLQSWVGISRLENKEGDTAVHEATRFNHVGVVMLLLDQDPHFNPSPNKSGESPLYLAARRGFRDLIDVIIEACGSPCYDGPNGRTSLHGAVVFNSRACLRKLLEWDKSLVHAEDEYSQTPLHYVARLGFENLVDALLSVDASTAYVANNEKKNTALLVAASVGHVSVVKELISHSPGCCKKVNGQGRNVLHIAIEHEQKDVIQYLLDECSSLISILIIQKDIDGNKPLHLLDTTSNGFMPNLIQHPMADKEALNDKDLTSLDFIADEDDHDDKKSSTSAAKNENTEEMNNVGAVSNLSSTTAPSDPNASKLREVINNHMIVASLIATVALTAGFAMPGGFIQSGSTNQGMVVLARNSIAFQAFVISDAAALLFSTTALFIYFVTVVLSEFEIDYNWVLQELVIGMILNTFALGAIIIAFITGTYAVLHYSYALAIASSVIASSVFLVHLAILIRLVKYVRT